MARDDMHVLVCKILSYLYTQLKEGGEIDERKLDEHALGIPHSYWTFIFSELKELGYTAGYTVVLINGGGHRIEKLGRTRITYRGVEYLTDDRFMKKVREEE